MLALHLYYNFSAQHVTLKTSSGDNEKVISNRRKRETCFQALASMADEVCSCTHISYGPPSALWSLVGTIGGKQRLNRRLPSHNIMKSEDGA